MADSATLHRIVGRDDELARLRSDLQLAAAGATTAVIISGEAGIGKTVLCEAATAELSDQGVIRLTVNALPLQALRTGLAPLRTALRRSSAPEDLTRACLARIDAGDPIRAVDDWVEDVVSQAPLVMLIDDLQWADPSLRDMVLYVLTGPRDRRLAVLIAVRDTNLPDGHPVHSWLADVLRLPYVNHLPVGPLDRSGTEAQLADLLGSRAHQSLVEEIYRAARGNPYYTGLLCRNLDASARHMPAEFPGDLTVALTGTWHNCSPPARFVARLLAVSGGPESIELLRDMVHDLGWSVDVTRAIDELQAVGLLERAADSRYWFHHPLQAEVLQRTVTDAERLRWQAAYARAGDVAASTTPSLDVAITQSLRHDQAGSAAAAYTWAMRAWKIGGPQRESPELRRVLRRAITLRRNVPATETVDLLWRRVRSAAADAGAFAEELEAVEALIEITDEAKQPLALSELLVRRMLLRVVAAIEFYSVADMTRAVALASADQSSWQFGLAQAELAHAGLWLEDPSAPVAARLALSIARASQHPTALSYACTSSAIAALAEGRPEAAQRLAAEAVDKAAAGRDWWAFVHAVMWETNACPEAYDWGEVGQLRRRRTQLSDLGGPDAYVLQLAAVEADLCLELGDWQTCARLLRETIVSDPGPMADLRLRLVMARLAALQGRTRDAIAHVDRARELVTHSAHLPNLNLDVTWATVLLEARRPVDALRVAMAAADRPGVRVDLAERLIPLAARAIADVVEEARDHQLSEVDALALLDELRSRFPAVIRTDDSDSPLGERRLAAMQFWYDAEIARARRSPTEPEFWVAMRERCIAGKLPWLEAYACWRAADVFLTRGQGSRAEGIAQLRAGHDLAVRLGAETVRSELADLARLAHVRLGTTGPAVAFDDTRLAHLTPREREILALLIRGLTYRDIAAALVISEKTVSSHVSNLLRKTETSNRVELTRLLSRTRPLNRSAFDASG
jgi:DNA-binding CsgD family transcriptional regulator